MLLTNKQGFVFTIGDNVINTRLTFRVLETLYNNLNDRFILQLFNIKDGVSPFDILNLNTDNYIRFYLFNLTKGRATDIEDIDSLIKFNKDNGEYEEFIGALRRSIMLDLIFIDYLEEESNTTTKSSEEDNKSNYSELEEFEQWYNYFYALSIADLNLSLEQFYDSTPSQLKEIIAIHFKKAETTVINAQCTLDRARYSSANINNTTKPKEVEAKDIYEFFNAI